MVNVLEHTPWGVFDRTARLVRLELTVSRIVNPLRLCFALI